ncbi:hypothetical protein [Candidatus Allofournierella merdipullorum]|uniref:hypothetical protein n=1 Tax=Candidatus Allofournierella merdipullorum TaxID=2838595 RepID=UPI002A85DE15|nr:hypothetical protein [Candidatus Fournierella merdipullorum]
MAKCLVGASGGLSAADREKLIPENLRKDVTLFSGTPKQVVGTYEMSVKQNKGATFAWNGTQSQNVTATHTVQKACTVIAVSLIDFAPGTNILEANGYVRLNGNEAPGRISTAYYKRCTMHMFKANPGDVVTVYSQGKSTQSYGTVNAIIMTDE